MANKRRPFGRIEKRPRGYRAAYVHDGITYRHPHNFAAKVDADGWLMNVKRRIDQGVWEPPDVENARKEAAQRSAVTFAVFAEDWITHRPLKPRTRSHYRTLLDRFILPEFGEVRLADISIGHVKTWHAALLVDRPTQRAHTYSLLRTILNDAVREQLILTNPCVVRGASNAPSVRRIEPLTPADLHALADAMPARWRMAALLAGWCGLRFGELAELRRSDIDVKSGTIRVDRAVVRVDGETRIGPPKSSAGRRTVGIPPHLLDELREHLNTHAAWGRDALVFPASHGGHLNPSSLYGKPPRERIDRSTGRKVLVPGSGFYAARAVIGRPSLRWHDLRHTGATLAALSGASLRELQGRLGHSTIQAALIYQHLSENRELEIAKALSTLAAAGSES